MRKRGYVTTTTECERFFLHSLKISKYWTFQSEFKIQNWCKTCLKILVRHSSASGIWTNFWRNDPEAVKAFKFLRSVEWNSVISSVQSTPRKYSGKAKCFLYARHFFPWKWHWNVSLSQYRNLWVRFHSKHPRLRFNYTGRKRTPKRFYFFDLLFGNIKKRPWWRDEAWGRLWSQ